MTKTLRDSGGLLRGAAAAQSCSVPALAIALGGESVVVGLIAAGLIGPAGVSGLAGLAVIDES